MASQAQIVASKRNAQKSCGTKSEAGKARARLNALKDGTHARTVPPVLPQENTLELDRRINRWIKDLNPQNVVERELVTRAAKLAWALDRAGRCETSRLAHRRIEAVRCGRRGSSQARWGQTKFQVNLKLGLTP
jgi:hypothetical protein